MKNEIKNMAKGIIFFLILLIILIPINQIFLENAYRGDRRFVQEKQFEKNSSETKIIAIGSSHTQTGFNPTYIPNSFNLGIPGVDIIKSYYRIKYILEHDAAPIEYILLEISMHRFYIIQSSIFNTRWYWAKYIPLKGYIELSTLSKDLKILDAINEKIRGTFPIIGERTEILSMIRYGSPEFNYDLLVKGHVQFTENFSEFNATERQRISKDKAKWHFESKEINQKIITYYKKFIELSRNHNIKVILIKYPMTQDYINATKTYIQNITAFYEQVFEKIKIYNLSVLDYQNIFLNQTTLFRDSDHLNKWGAELLSQQINIDLKNLGAVIE